MVFIAVRCKGEAETGCDELIILHVNWYSNDIERLRQSNIPEKQIASCSKGHNNTYMKQEYLYSGIISREL
jgi:hypothetical protein